jgi:hypothetical protein
MSNSSDASSDLPQRGRPPRSVQYGAARHWKTFRVHPGEDLVLKERQRAGGFATLDDTIREALSLPIKHPTKIVRFSVPAVIDRDAFLHLAQIGNNINQISRVLNSALAAGTVTNEMVEQIHRELARIRFESKAP